MSKNGWFSSAQAPNPRPVSDVSNALQAINSKLDMILDALTKPAEKVELPQATIAVNDELAMVSPGTKAFLDHWANNPPRIGPSRPAALDVDDEYCSMKMPKGTEEEVKGRLSGDPAKEQIDEWILEEYKTFQRFATQVGAGRVKARIYPTPPTSKQRKTHTIELKATDTNSEFRPGIYGKTELDEVVAYLESLGINVKNKAPNRV
jgi:hypothetical protein